MNNCIKTLLPIVATNSVVSSLEGQENLTWPLSSVLLQICRTLHITARLPPCSHPQSSNHPSLLWVLHAIRQYTSTRLLERHFENGCCRVYEINPPRLASFSLLLFAHPLSFVHLRHAFHNPMFSTSTNPNEMYREYSNVEAYGASSVRLCSRGSSRHEATTYWLSLSVLVVTVRTDCRSGP